MGPRNLDRAHGGCLQKPLSTVPQLGRLQGRGDLEAPAPTVWHQGWASSIAELSWDHGLNTYEWLLNTPRLSHSMAASRSFHGDSGLQQEWSSPGIGCTASHDIALQVWQHHFGHTLLIQVFINLPRFKQGVHTTHLSMGSVPNNFGTMFKSHYMNQTTKVLYLGWRVVCFLVCLAPSCPAPAIPSVDSPQMR